MLVSTTPGNYRLLGNYAIYIWSYAGFLYETSLRTTNEQLMNSVIVDSQQELEHWTSKSSAAGPAC